MNSLLINSGIFNDNQLKEIKVGLMQQLDVSMYADPAYNHQQMSVIRMGLESKLDVSLYADPTIHYSDMLLTYFKLLGNKKNVS